MILSIIIIMSQSGKDDDIGIDLTEVVTPTELAVLNPKAKYNIRQVRYSEETKALVIALHSSGYSYREIEKAVGVGRTQIGTWINQLNDESIQRYDNVAGRIKEVLAAKCATTANRALAGITDEKLEEESAYRLSLIAGISIDKMRLMSGESTENHAHIVKSSSRSDNQLKKERDKLSNIKQRIRDLGGECDE